MTLPETCYTTACASQTEKPHHKGVCPAGWHLPTNAEWDELLRYVDGTSGTETPYTSSTAGKYLKAKEVGNSMDTFGFAALLGGFRGST